MSWSMTFDLTLSQLRSSIARSIQLALWQLLSRKSDLFTHKILWAYESLRLITEVRIKVHLSLLEVADHHSRCLYLILKQAILKC